MFKTQFLYSGIRLAIGGLALLAYLASARAAEPTCVAPASLNSTESSANAPYAGDVLFIQGKVTAQLPGARIRILSKGTPVCEGDTLISGERALMQLHMADGGKLVLREQTYMTIDAFAMPTTANDSERFAVSLVKGVLRAVTGLIGKLNKDRYSIRTTNAVIGIRGTDHEVFHVPPEALPPARIAEAGTYNRVFSGITVLQSAAGQVQLGPSQIGFAPLSGASPTILKALPNFLGVLPTEIHGALQQKRAAKAVAANVPAKEAPPENSASATPAEAAPGTDTAGSSTISQAEAAPQEPASDVSSVNGGQAPAASTMPDQESDAIAVSDDITVPVKVTVAGVEVDLNASADQTFPAQAGSAYVGAHVTGIGSGAKVATGGAISDDLNTSIHLDATTGVPVVVANGSGGFNYQSLRAQLLDFGMAEVDGVGVMWGLYDGGAVIDPATGLERSLGFHHFAFAPGGATASAVISSLSGTARFSTIIGFSQPTSETGLVRGTLQSMDVSVNLGANPGVTSYFVNVQDAHMREWTGGFTGFAPLAGFTAGGLPLTTSCSGAGCGSGSGDGTAAGLLIGDTGRGLITTYGLSTTSGESVAGAAVLSQDKTVSAPPNSAYVGAQVLNTNGGVDIDTGGAITDERFNVQLEVGSGRPVVVRAADGFLYQAEQATLLDFGAASVDGATVKWGLYEGGTVTNSISGGESEVGFHHFAFAPGGATPRNVINALSGTVRFSDVVGSTPPTIEGGLFGGTLQSLDVDVTLGATPGITRYNVNVLDVQKRNWAGRFSGFVTLTDFDATQKLQLSTSCSGIGCGSGLGTGSATGMLVGNNAKGLITTYGLSTTTGQGVAGAAVLTRP